MGKTHKATGNNHHGPKAEHKNNSAHSRTNGKADAGHQRPTASGTLIIIGGREDKSGECAILREVAGRVRSGTLVVATLASQVAGELWREYKRIFQKLGVERIEHLELQHRTEAEADTASAVLTNAAVIFFTGGSQLRITGLLGGTPLCERIQELYWTHGITIAGTSAGASVLSDTMLVSGESEESHRVSDALHMAPGLGLIQDVIIDQHFAQRGRIGRLLGAVGQNPRILGVGIDEDTAVIVERDEAFRVIGSGAVYVLDGRGVSSSNISEEEAEQTLSIFDMRLHVLSRGDTFQLKTRRPLHPPSEEEKRDARSEDQQGSTPSA
jgi:cyanophycinase